MCLSVITSAWRESRICTSEWSRLWKSFSASVEPMLVEKNKMISWRKVSIVAPSLRYATYGTTAGEERRCFIGTSPASPHPPEGVTFQRWPTFTTWAWKANLAFTVWPWMCCTCSSGLNSLSLTSKPLLSCGQTFANTWSEWDTLEFYRAQPQAKPSLTHR